MGLIYTVQFLFLRIVLIQCQSAICDRSFSTTQHYSMSLVSTVLQDAAREHAAALLSPSQANPGDKLPLIETVKETDATPIKLAPSGKTIIVRILCTAPPCHVLLFLRL